MVPPIMPPALVVATAPTAEVAEVATTAPAASTAPAIPVVPAAPSSHWLARLDPRLGDQLRFLMEIDRLKGIVRANRVADGSRRENTAEHSWHVAMFATVLAEHAVGEVSVARVVRMLLIHDIVEIDAGDTPLHAQDAASTQAGSNQAATERAAAERLFGLLPDDQANGFRALWDEFETAESDDARFAKALDRLSPILLNHAVGGGTWTDYDVDEGQVRARTGRIAGGSPELWRVAEAVFADAVARGWLRTAPSPGG